MFGLFQDLGFALRQLRKSPGLTLLVMLTLAVGIGASTSIFSVVYGVLLRPLPYSDSNRIAAIYEIKPNGGWSRLADPNFDDFRDQNHSFEAIAKYTDDLVSVSGGSQPTRTAIAYASADFLKVFRVQPILGRDFRREDNVKGAAPVVLVSYGYWKQYFEASPRLSQLRLKISNSVYSVIGVLPPRFQFPQKAALWIPAGDDENPSRTSHNYSAVARLRDGVTVEQARSEISAIARRIHNASSIQNDYLLKDATVVPLKDSITVRARPVLLILLGAVGFLLLVACANVANLLLSQASARDRELAVRSALGAKRARLVRQFVTEAFLVSFVGGGLGVLGAFWGVAGLIALAPPGLPRANDISINSPVLTFALLLSTAVAIGLGAFTAMRGTSSNVRDGLANSSRGHAGSQTTQRVGRAIVAAQMAITLVLVVGTGLLGRTLLKVLEVNPGFRVDKIITMDVSLPWMDWTDLKGRASQGLFFARLIDRVKQIPGVHDVGATSGIPMDEGLPDGMFLLMNQDEAPKTPDTTEALTREFDRLFAQKERIGEADFCVATEGFFQVLGIPLVRGRMFGNQDGPDSPHVAVISESLARERWPGQDPLGHTIEVGNMDGDVRLVTIVGIVGDVHEYGLDVPPRPTVYVNLIQRPRSTMTITMLSEGNPQLITSAARDILHEFDPEVAANFRMFSQIYLDSLGSRRFNLILVGFFAGTALLLASAGVFGVMAYSVSRRTREIGVRVALGARSGDVLTMILGQGLRTVLLGVAIGIVISLAVTWTMQSLLFGVTAADPLTFAAVIVLLLIVAMLACYFPARRAAKVDPMVALRYE